MSAGAVLTRIRRAGHAGLVLLFFIQGAALGIWFVPLSMVLDAHGLHAIRPFAFAAFPSWRRVFANKSGAAQKAVYADPVFRNQFREDLKNPMGFGNWARITLHEVPNPELKRFTGQTVATAARADGKDGVDAVGPVKQAVCGARSGVPGLPHRTGDDRVYTTIDDAYHAVFLRRVNDLRSS